MWTIQLPLRVPVSKSSEFALNLNQYRNAHFQVLDKAKKKFDQIAQGLIRSAAVPRLERVALEYVLWTRNAQLCDVSNVCSIVDKFFSDALKNAKVIEDDNYTYIADLHFRFGGIDRENPRVDVIIRDPAVSMVPLEPFPEREPVPMKISTRSIHVVNFTKDDLINAVRKYLTDEGHITIPADANLGNLMELQDGSFELRVEVGGAVEESTGKKTGGGRKANRTDPKTAMQAVNAAHTAQTGTTQPTATTSDKPSEEPAPQPSKTALSAKEQAAKEAEELERQEREEAERKVKKEDTSIPAETPANDEPEAETEATGSPDEEETTGAVSEIDLSPKTELEKQLDAVKGTPEEAEVRAKVEREREVKADPVGAMQNAKTQEELDYAYGFTDKGKGPKAVYESCKESIATTPPKKPSLFSPFTRPKN